MMFFGGEILPDVNLLLVKVAGGNSERVSEGGVHVDGVVAQLQFAVRDAGEIEEIVDEQGFELDVAPENVEVAPGAVGDVEIALQRRDGRKYRGERGAQFVRQH